MGVVLVFLKSYFLFIHLVWMQIADLPLAVLLLLLAVAGLAVLGGATLFARLASRYRSVGQGSGSRSAASFSSAS